MAAARVNSTNAESDKRLTPGRSWRRCGCGDRAQAVVLAYEAGVLRPGDR
jgi:hypothetical protein